MFNSAILDIAIGLVFLYVLLSLLCSTIKEAISQFLSLRAKNLEEGIKNLLRSESAKDFVGGIYAHPLIKSLSKAGEKPSYIPSRNFALALLDVLSGNNGKLPEKKSELVAALEKEEFANTSVGKAVTLLISDAGDDMAKARQNLETWYNDSMDRVGGWYKRKAQNIILIVALVVCFSLNIDSIKIAQTLWADTALRTALVEAASKSDPQQLIPSPKEEASSPASPAGAPGEGSVIGLTPGTAPGDVQPQGSEADGKKEADQALKKNVAQVMTLYDQIKGLKLPIGWEGVSLCGLKANALITKLFGIFITALAASLGAPFWFDLLNKLVNLRSSGKAPTTPPKPEDI